jgi:hypothetical protein
MDNIRESNIRELKILPKEKEQLDLLDKIVIRREFLGFNTLGEIVKELRPELLNLFLENLVSEEKYDHLAVFLGYAKKYFDQDGLDKLIHTLLYDRVLLKILLAMKSSGDFAINMEGSFELSEASEYWWYGISSATAYYMLSHDKFKNRDVPLLNPQKPLYWAFVLRLNQDHLKELIEAEPFIAFIFIEFLETQTESNQRFIAVENPDFISNIIQVLKDVDTSDSNVKRLQDILGEIVDSQDIVTQLKTRIPEIKREDGIDTQGRVADSTRFINEVAGTLIRLGDDVDALSALEEFRQEGLITNTEFGLIKTRLGE